MKKRISIIAGAVVFVMIFVLSLAQAQEEALTSAGERFRHADTNNDGVLNLEECKAEKQYEKAHYEKIAKDTFKDLKKKYPGIDFKDVN